MDEDFAEQQRRMMRVALARHMKRELIESEQDRLTKVVNLQQHAKQTQKEKI